MLVIYWSHSPPLVQHPHCISLYGPKMCNSTTKPMVSRRCLTLGGKGLEFLSENAELFPCMNMREMHFVCFPWCTKEQLITLYIYLLKPVLIFCGGSLYLCMNIHPLNKLHHGFTAKPMGREWYHGTADPIHLFIPETRERSRIWPRRSVTVVHWPAWKVMNDLMVYTSAPLNLRGGWTYSWSFITGYWWCLTV